MTVGRAIESFTVDGPIAAQWKSKPLGKEIMTARRISANGHAVEFLAAVGGGRHPDIRVDGIVAELKRPDSRPQCGVHAATQGKSAGSAMRSDRSGA